MTEIQFQQLSPKGTATLDTSRLLIGTDGRAFMRSSHDGRLVPLGAEQEQALADRFGKSWRDAVAAVEVLA